MASSPSHDATWRTLDKASIVDIINLTQDIGSSDEADDLHNMHVVLEFRADGFLLGELPRLISTIVSMANGWLPTNFFEIATRSDIYIAAPPKSPFADGMMYFHSPRYHFHELTAIDDVSSNTSHMFDSCINGGQAEYEWEKEMRSNLIVQSSTISQDNEREWLVELRDVVSTSIKHEIQSISKSMAALAVDEQGLDKESQIMLQLPTGCPDGAFTRALELLRDIVSNEQWPATSMARSRVIKSTTSGGAADPILTSKKGSVGTAFPGNAQSSGSFTVVNMEILNEDSGIPLPAANSRFPDLAKAVFDLEKEIIESERPIPAADGMTRGTAQRQLSSHCAVNRVRTYLLNPQ